jgi:hypothetical protein
MPQESWIAKQVAFATGQKYVKIYFVARIFYAFSKNLNIEAV